MYKMKCKTCYKELQKDKLIGEVSDLPFGMISHLLSVDLVCSFYKSNYARLPETQDTSLT